MLTDPQKATLKAYIQSVPELNDLYVIGNLSGLADALNATHSPPFIVWKQDVSVDEIMRNGMDWARVDNLTVGKARIWDWLGRLGTFDASKPNVRAGIDSAWVGTAADLAVRAAIYVHCKKPCSVIQKIFATGTGADASPATMTYADSIGYYELIGL